MRRLLTLVFLAAVAVPAAAQVATPRPPRPARPPADTGERGYGYWFGPEGAAFQVFRRGRLGIQVDLSADPARDSIGARVAGVSPGGPADKAGVQTGDIVVRLNGTRLAGTEAHGEAEDAESRPGGRLIELASRLDGGDTVRLEVRRDNRTLNLTVVAGTSGMDELVRRFRVEALPGRAGTRFQVPGGEINYIMTGQRFSDLELVKVNPGLAEYFGTSEGLLVVDAPRDSSLGLKSGDVILTIGGRRPTSPAHAQRILGTYEPNESVSFEVMRMKRRITVTGKISERGGWRSMHNSFDFDQMDQLQDELLELRESARMLMPGLPMLRELPRMMIQLPPMPVDRLPLARHAVET